VKLNPSYLKVYSNNRKKTFYLKGINSTFLTTVRKETIQQNNYSQSMAVFTTTHEVWQFSQLIAKCGSYHNYRIFRGISLSGR